MISVSNCMVLGRAAVCGLLLLLVLLASSPTASAHTLTFIQDATTTTCPNPGQTAPTVLYDNAGPVDRTWVINVGVDLQGGGPDVHDAYFTFHVTDNASGSEIARFEGAAHDWIQILTKNYTSTLFAHAGGTFDLTLQLTNAGSTYRCFGVLAYAAYK